MTSMILVSPSNTTYSFRTINSMIEFIKYTIFKNYKRNESRRILVHSNNNILKTTGNNSKYD